MRTALRLLPLALLACGGDSGPAPWLTYPGVDGHARYLPLAGTSHDPRTHPSVTCDACHPGPTFQQPVCTGCHGRAETAAVHTSASTGNVLKDYAWTAPPGAGTTWQPPSCLRCHPQGGVPDVDHDRYFPIGTGTKHARTCSSCHADALDKGNLAQLRCVACHAGSGVAVPLPGTHTRVLRPESYPAVPTAADCLRCHAGGKVDRVASHGAKAGPPGFGPAGPWDGSADEERHGTPGTAVNCFACHNAPPPLFGGKGPGVRDRPWAQDWKIPAATAGQTAAGACRGCHGPS